MEGWIAISMEKYATSPSAGNASWEREFNETACIVFAISAALPGCEATIYE